MSVYAFWNNKGGVGKSYLTFQIASEYARVNPDKKVLVLDLCPQANSSGMLLGGMESGDSHLDTLGSQYPKRTISGYIEGRILSPYQNPMNGSGYALQVSSLNSYVPSNLYLVPGDEQLEIQASRVLAATNPGPTDAWRYVHTWITDLIEDIKASWNQAELTVFIDCNPSFSIYTELALSASDRLIIPFSADGSSKRAVRALLALVYGISRSVGNQQSDFYNQSVRFRMNLPKIYCYVGNRLTQFLGSATAFRTVVREIGDEVFNVWLSNPNVFFIHPQHAGPPANRKQFNGMFQYEIVDANTASVVSSALGRPIMQLAAGKVDVLGKSVMVNQSQLNRQQPNISALVRTIEP